MPAVAVRSYAQWRADYESLVGRLAADAEKLMRSCVQRGGFPVVYLAGRKVPGADTHNPAAIFWDEIQPIDGRADRNDLELISPMSLPMSLPYSEYRRWVDDRLRSEPLAILAD